MAQHQRITWERESTSSRVSWLLMCSNYNTFNWQVPVPVLWEESEAGHFLMFPECLTSAENVRMAERVSMAATA